MVLCLLREGRGRFRPARESAGLGTSHPGPRSLLPPVAEAGLGADNAKGLVMRVCRGHWRVAVVDSQILRVF